jgi:hypothetical protein
MTEKSWADIHWQPIESLSLIRSMVDGLLDETEKQYAPRILPVETACARRLHR